jgi:hypothetical protein
MAEEPHEQRDDRAARKQQLNGQIRAGVARDLNQCVHDAVTPCHSGAPEIRCILGEGMLLAVRIPLISDHDRIVARLFRVQVNEAAGRELGAWARRQQINVMFEVRRAGTRDVIFVLLLAR